MLIFFARPTGAAIKIETCPVSMDYKKILILPALFICSTVLYIGCCQCMDHSKNLYKVTSLRVFAYGSNQTVVDTGAVTMVDTIYLNYSLMGHCIAKATTDLSFLMNTASAWSCKCDGCGEKGLKDSVAEVSITSDSVYNNIPANQPLNQFFKMNDLGAIQAFDSLVNYLNRPMSNYYGVNIFTTQKPNNNQGHVFKLTMRFVSGLVLTTDTRRIFWR
ncbi:MAG: hypothetical protein EOO06_09545 [Chitinophagaceae bacterium]|nr:MAG: hypothetical protein EOO06_09545 [Chitinophagaceae bacterium]